MNAAKDISVSRDAVADPELRTSGASSATFSPRRSRMMRATIASTLCGSIGTSHCGQYCVPSFMKSSRRK